MLLAVPDADDADIGNVLAADEFGLELGGWNLEALYVEKARLVSEM